MNEFKGISQDRLKVRFPRPEDKISRRELLKLASPLGKVTLDGSKCTGCGLCALDCPTEALNISLNEEGDSQLLFRHDLCIACGKCVEVCPEQCLQLERTLELDKIGSPAAVLFDDKAARCCECGNIIGSSAMIERLQIKILAKEKSLASRFDLCPTCKIKAQFSKGRASPESANKLV
ncbi:4Fe-4S dicluster domain-containing protein [Chloroflexota bacterium]